jgi:UDP-MurNAc hydroxylase
MKIYFVGHSSLVVECADTAVLMDPWLFGKVFNNSWTLLPEPAIDPAILEKVDYLWISHEHPDHCHFPSLDSLPREFKERVTVLYQDRDYQKMVAAFRKLGYRNFRLLPHREVVKLSDRAGADTAVYCYHDGLMDSALAVIGDGKTILNANDARISTSECGVIRKDIGEIDVLLNQFSLAAYAGFEPREKYLPARARQILDNVAAVAKKLEVKVVIPIASFMYFSSIDNKYLNTYMNTVRDTYDFLTERGQKTIVLYPGETYEVGTERDSTAALARYDELPGIDERSYDPIESKPFAEIVEAYDQLAAQMREHYPSMILKRLRPVTIRIPDLDKTVQFKLDHGPLTDISNTVEPDLVINSQPLWFAFKFPFGVQTLGTSARFSLLRHTGNWKIHRILFSLNNGGIYLRPKFLLTSEMVGYFRKRLIGGLRQSVHYYRTSL